MRKKGQSRLMIKEWAVVLVGLLTLAIAMTVSQKASAISLKAHSVVEHDTITLGDIFSGVDGEKAERILGAAPQPGNDMVLNSYTLMRIAVALDLPWRPATSADQVVLRRAATVIEPDQIKARVKEAIAGKDLPGKFEVNVITPLNKIALPQEEDATMDVISLEVHPAQNTFNAVLVAPSQENPIQQINVSGNLQRMIDVPVLRETISNGDIIGDGDIEYVEMRAEAVNPDVFLKGEDMIGLTPRRIALAGKPMRDNDLMAPQVVERGEFVTMVFANNGLSLTAKGKALQNGAKGDNVRVVNTSSNKTIEGIVTGDREVTVASF